jgi:predicted TIM-barrel fold metal-dependent hydrolase
MRPYGSMGRVAWLRNNAGILRPATYPSENKALELSKFWPKSMLHVSETKVARSFFPAIDFHTHLSWSAASKNGVALGEKMRYLATPEQLLEVMDRKNIRVMVNLTGGVGTGLEESIRKYQLPYPERFLVFAEPWWSRTDEPGYSQFQADEIVRVRRTGARGLKVLKTLGLYLREEIITGSFVKVDDRRFDPMWEVCGSLNMPVAIHISDPAAFFLRVDHHNERYEELMHHPDWSYYDRGSPSTAELLEARNRVLARHPKTHFIAVHVGNSAENLAYTSECLDCFSNMYVDIAARIGELGRQPRTSRRFFEKYQDRILFGTDLFPKRTSDYRLYEVYFRFLESEDEYFDYAPTSIPPQGRWRIYGLGLPEGILRKIYFENAARLLGLGCA